MKKSNAVAGITLLFLLIAGCCTTRQSASPKATLPPTMTPIIPISLSAEPAWLTILYPKPGQVVLLEEYNASKHETHRGSLPAPEAPSAICVEIWAEYLFEPGDFWEMKDVTERTDLLVDGIQRQRSGGGYDGIVLHTITNLGEEVARVGGPYAFCFSARLQPGIHRADISFRRSSGMTKEYAWTFEITSHPIPTPTPLPDPPTIDSVGDLPSFLEAVYPAPGTTISLTQYQKPTGGFWEYLGPEAFRAQQAVCFAFRVDELYKLGSLPRNYQDWPDRIFVQVDGNLSGYWFYPTSYQGDSSSGRITAHCVRLQLSLGQHNAAIYVHPFDDDLVIYSWSFSLAE